MKKFFIIPLILVSFFIFGIHNVKAEVIPAYYHFKDDYITCSTGYGYCQDNLPLFQNLNKGTMTGEVTFNFIADPQILLNSVQLYVGNNPFVCRLGTQTIYSDNTTGYNLYTAICPINIDNRGINKIRFDYDDEYYNGNSFKFFMGEFYSFYQDLSPSDYTTLLNTINNTVGAWGNSIYFKINDTYGVVNNIYNQITNSNTKLEDIKSKLDSLNSASTNISNNTEQIKNDIKSDDTSGAEGSADSLKNNSAFQDNSGLSAVISMPLTFVNSLTNTCQPINLNIPYMDVDVSIPCMQPIISNKMPLLANLIKIVVNGFIVYRILLDIFQIVRNAKNPEDDRIEVLDL